MNRSDDIFPQPGGTPDPYWQRAFDDAADTPPPRVWEGVERQLDLDESDGILPLWQHREGRQSMLFGRWVAGIAASLLLTALGWWAWHREDAIRPDVAVAVASRPLQTAPATALAPADATVAGANPQTVQPSTLLASTAKYYRVNRAIRRQNKPGTLPDATALAVVGKRVEPTDKAIPQPDKQTADPALDRAGESGSIRVFTETTITMSMRMKVAEPYQSVGVGSQPASMSRSVLTQSFSTQSIAGQSQSGHLPPAEGQPTTLTPVPAAAPAATLAAPDSPERITMAGAPLPAKPSPIRQQADDRIAVTDNEASGAEPATTASKKRRQRPWLSAGVVASAFNPTVAMRSAFSPAGNSPQNIANGSAATAAPTLQSQVGRAVAFQAGLGIPLGEHWSIETGVGYLSGQNEVQSPARVSSLTSAIKSGAADNLYVDLIGRLADQSALANYSAGASNAALDAIRANQASNYASNQQQGVSNLYQFVQVPLQVGYELRPRRKVGLALLTGMVSNWFMRNTVAESITIKVGDGVYRPVTLAGTVGMRLRYRPDNHWSASVAGTFQQSLQSLTRTDVSLQAQPQQVGLSFSVDRHF